MKSINLNEKEILGINVPEKLFIASTEDDVKKIYRKLSTIWHPDKHIADGKDTTFVFAHIQNLYEKSLLKFKNDEWNKSNLLKLEDISGSIFEIRYVNQSNFDLGVFYIGKEIIAYEFMNDDESFLKNYIKRIESLKFANKKMEEEITKYLPLIKKVIKTKDKSYLIVQKDKETISLRDVLAFYNGFIDPKHVAWILSNMYNLACFNQYNNLMQAGFSLDNYFIVPEQHTGHLIGGWWFSQNNNEKLIALSSEAVNVAPVKMLNNKQADIKLDLELIKLVGRQLLGNSTGIKLRKDSRIPKQLIDWLNDSSNMKPFDAYDTWQNKILKESFGVRRFIKMDLRINDIYN